MALKLTLKPGERFVVNGAVIANGDRRASLVIQNKVSILREKDIMQEESVGTPARHIYFPIMLSYLDPEKGSRYYLEFVQRMTEFMNVIENRAILATCVEISGLVMSGHYYRALTECKKLIAYEEGLLNHVSGRVSPGADRRGVAAAD